ncbi:uncharacterized [Tachysurus ichikawai]
MVTACRPSGSCCKCHLHTSQTPHFRDNADPAVFPEAIPADSCICCLRECAPGAHFLSFLQQKHNPKSNPKALLSLTGGYTSPERCIDRSRDTAALNIINIFLRYFRHLRPLVFPQTTGRFHPRHVY